MRRLIQALAIVALATVSGWSQESAEVARGSETLGRGDSVSIVVTNVPEKVKATGIRFDSTDNAQTWTADGEGLQQTDPVDKKITVSGQVSADAALGKYRLSVIFDNKKTVPVRGPVLVQPAGTAIQLNEFSPPNIYDSKVVWAQDPQDERKGIPVRTVDLVLRGSGFLANHEDNVIWINKAPLKVRWDTCSAKLPESSSTHPIQVETIAEFVSPREIRLCRVLVPDDGQMLVAVGFGNTPGDARMFRVFSMSTGAVAWRAAMVAVLLALLPLALLSFAKRSYSIGNQPYKLRMLFLDPETDTYSLSKLQFYLWTVVSIFAYAYLFIAFVKVQNLPWPDVPATLPGIIAVAAGTAVGSQLVSSTKGSKGAGDQHPSISDFITSGGVVAPDRLQMFLWTLIGVGAFFIAVIEQGPGTISELPAVPERLLYLMGISSAGYLGGKMARAAGPVINEISVTPAESDAGIANASAPVNALPDLVEAVTEAQNAVGQFPGIANSNATAAITALSDAIKSAKAAQTVTEWNQLIETLRTLKGKAEQAARDAATDFQAKKATQADAETAQKAASTLQDFSANVTQALTRAGATAMMPVESPALIVRKIELRGTNMSSEGLFEMDHVDLPFRMLFSKDGQNAPDIAIREDSNPKFSRLLRLTIDPARLGPSDLEQFRKWFSVDGVHTFTLTNPDGQKAELSFKVPPGEMQKVGSA